MKSPRTYFRLALIVSILFGVALPLAFGVKNVRLFGVLFTFIWLIYAITLFVWVFLITGRRDLKKRLKDGITDKWGYS